MNAPTPQDDPRRAAAPDETPETLAVAAFLRAHDPALAFPAGLDEARRRRLLRCMRHPRVALLLLHHRTLALAGAAVAVALVVLALWWLVRTPAEQPVLSIRIRPAPVETPAVPLEPPLPAEDPTDGAEPLPFNDPSLAEPLPADEPVGADEPDEPEEPEVSVPDDPA